MFKFRIITAALLALTMVVVGGVGRPRTSSPARRLAPPSPARSIHCTSRGRTQAKRSASIVRMAPIRSS